MLVGVTTSAQPENDHPAVDDQDGAVEQKLGEASRPWPRLLILLLIHSRQRATTSYHETADQRVGTVDGPAQGNTGPYLLAQLASNS